MYQPTRREWTFIFLAGLMITNAVTAELISSKLIDIPLEFNLLGWHVGPFTTIVGLFFYFLAQGGAALFAAVGAGAADTVATGAGLPDMDL